MEGRSIEHSERENIRNGRESKERGGGSEGGGDGTCVGEGWGKHKSKRGCDGEGLKENL